MKHSMPPRARQAHRRHAIAIAVSLFGLMPAMQPAQAQFYDYSGQVSTYPTNLFPIDTGVAALDLGADNTLGVGGGSFGSFSALAGAQLSVGSLTVAIGGIGGGSMAVNGGQVLLTGIGNRLQVGAWGTGSLVVSNGGLLDATANAGVCTGGNCINFIGNLAGSTATLTVTGTGSEVRALRGFYVGGLGVFSPANAGLDTHASVNVLAGGTLRTEGASIGLAPGGSQPTGTEKSFADVTIDGVGSRWIVSPNSFNNAAAGMGIATAANSTSTVTVRNGGQLRIDGSSGAGPNDFLNIGQFGGKGELVVTGSGSRVDVVGIDPVLQVGRAGSTSTASFSVLAGAAASTLYLNVGRDGATGTMLIDGAGSVVNQVGVGVVNSGNTGTPAGASIGRAGGQGQVTVGKGGRWFLSDGGGDGRASNSSPGLSIGFAQGVAGSNGALTIDGVGSVVEVVGSTLGLLPGQPDNFNPFVGVGRDVGSTGSLTVSNGGKLQLTGNAVSTVANSRSTTFQVGGTSDTVAGGTGFATITGPGSQVRVEGSGAFVGIGRNGTGTLTMTDQALLVSTFVNVGRSPLGVGTLTMDASTIELSGQDTGSFLSGANFSVGTGGATGTASIGNGSLLTITNFGTSGASLNLGGSSVFQFGNGQLTLSGGSTINVVAAPTLGSFTVGRDGSGSATITGASRVDVTNGNVHVGRLAGATGSMFIDGGSRVQADSVNIGGSSDTTAGGIGSTSVTGLGSELRATGANGFIGVGRSGSGTLSLNNQGLVSGIILNVGRATGGVGTLTVDNASIALSGQQTTGILVGAAMGIGIRGGTGTATLDHGSSITISNLGSNGASLNVGGSPFNNPLGTGTLTVNNGSQITLSALPGLANARIGHDGSGTATFSQGSALNVSGGNIIIAGQPGSTGTLTLNSGSVLNADYVGVGSNPGGIDGGTGSLFINNSTVNTTTLEIGKFGLLGGDGGVINGNVINRGTFSPGNSPGRVKIDGGFISTESSQILLDVQSDGNGGFLVDTIVLTPNYAFGNLNVTFRFLGNTDPMAAASAGVLDLDNFLRVATATGDSGLSTGFTIGQTWNTLLAGATFSATSSAYNVTDLKLNFDGTGNFSFNATPVPEPSQWLLSLAGLLVLGFLVKRRRGGV